MRRIKMDTKHELDVILNRYSQDVKMVYKEILSKDTSVTKKTSERKQDIEMLIMKVVEKSDN